MQSMSCVKRAYDVTDEDIKMWGLPDAEALGRCEVGV
jgi:hypothetical protein